MESLNNQIDDFYLNPIYIVDTQKIYAVKVISKNNRENENLHSHINNCYILQRIMERIQKIHSYHKDSFFVSSTVYLDIDNEMLNIENLHHEFIAFVKNLKICLCLNSAPLNINKIATKNIEKLKSYGIEVWLIQNEKNYSTKNITPLWDGLIIESALYKKNKLKILNNCQFNVNKIIITDKKTDKEILLTNRKTYT